jgi:hypothetical protein
MLSCYFLTLDLEAPPPSMMFLLFKTFFKDYIATFLMFSNVVYISSLVFLTLVYGLYGLLFC